MGTKVSEHFSLEELTFSDTAVRLGRAIEVPNDIGLNLQWLCERVLEPIRCSLDLAMHINSGYRPLWLNSMVGGSSTSDHVKGLAADITAAGFTPRQLAERIEKVMPTLPIQQLILEFDSWVHVSAALPGTKPKRQVLTATKRNGSTVYLPGLQP